MSIIYLVVAQDILICRYADASQNLSWLQGLKDRSEQILKTIAEHPQLIGVFSQAMLDNVYLNLLSQGMVERFEADLAGFRQQGFDLPPNYQLDNRVIVGTTDEDIRFIDLKFAEENGYRLITHEESRYAAIARLRYGERFASQIWLAAQLNQFCREHVPAQSESPAGDRYFSFVVGSPDEIAIDDSPEDLEPAPDQPTAESAEPQSEILDQVLRYPRSDDLPSSQLLQIAAVLSWLLTQVLQSVDELSNSTNQMDATSTGLPLLQWLKQFIQIDLDALIENILSIKVQLSIDAAGLDPTHAESFSVPLVFGVLSRFLNKPLPEAPAALASPPAGSRAASRSGDGTADDRSAERSDPAAVQASQQDFAAAQQPIDAIEPNPTLDRATPPLADDRPEPRSSGLDLFGDRSDSRQPSLLPPQSAQPPQGIEPSGNLPQAAQPSDPLRTSGSVKPTAVTGSQSGGSLTANPGTVGSDQGTSADVSHPAANVPNAIPSPATDPAPDISHQVILPPAALAGQQTLVIQVDATQTILGFGGVGQGVNPSQAVVDEVDTLKFVGAGLTAPNLILTQSGSDLQITFAGASQMQVILKDFSLENLDNLNRGTWAAVTLGNLLFDGQTAIEDSFDVFNADENPIAVYRPHTVTFLNDLNNTTQGFDNANDVINGQGGDDCLSGLSGDDLLRGGTGNDQLWGGAGEDVLVGDQGDDLLVGGLGADTLVGGEGCDRFLLTPGEGTDVIQDFQIGKDRLQLAGNLLSSQLVFVQDGSNTRIDWQQQTLAILLGVQAVDLRAALSQVNQVNQG
ncbi:MAG TPA: hypothetical protein V6C57_21400 [Coleofasciculaceae cyanobacterium]